MPVEDGDTVDEGQDVANLFSFYRALFGIPFIASSTLRIILL